MKFIGLLTVTFFSAGFHGQMPAESGKALNQHVESESDHPFGTMRHAIVVDILGQLAVDKQVKLRSTIVLPTACTEVSFDVSNSGSHEHYVDYFFQDNGEKCTKTVDEETALINLGYLSPGKHTVIFVGPSWEDFEFSFKIPEVRSLDEQGPNIQELRSAGEELSSI
jgi:hypothetical protein